MSNSDNRNILDEILFFTGAGFSVEAGLYTSNKMMKEIIEMIQDNNNNYFTEIEKEIIRFVLSALLYYFGWHSFSPDNSQTFTYNIEDFILVLRRIKNKNTLLPAPITGNWADILVNLEAKYNGRRESLYENILRKIGELVERWIRNINREKLTFLDDLKTFLNDPLNADLILEWVTLNYDTVLETYFENEGIVNTGFVAGKWREAFCEKASSSYVDPYEGKINYYKLHGSVNWKRLEDGSVVNENYVSDNIEEYTKPYWILGQGTKLFTVEPFFDLLYKFKQLLKEKKFFIVIGYSFFDPHINNLFINAVKNDPDKRIIIVNPQLFSIELSEKHVEIDNYKIKWTKEEIVDDVKKKIDEVQKLYFYSELPEFNYTGFGESIIYFKEKAGDFINKVFQPINNKYVIELILRDLEKSEEMF